MHFQIHTPICKMCPWLGVSSAISIHELFFSLQTLCLHIILSCTKLGHNLTSMDEGGCSLTQNPIILHSFNIKSPCYNDKKKITRISICIHILVNTQQSKIKK